jgi:hypothetical protein
LETVASRFYRWRRQGIWDRVSAALQADTDARGELDWLLHLVDGSVVRAHQHAAGGRTIMLSSRQRRADVSEMAHISRSCSEARACLADLGKVPLTVITSSEHIPGDAPGSPAAQKMQPLVDHHMERAASRIR